MSPIGVDGGTDNSHFAQKADMRLTFLRDVGWPELGVLDLCAGASKLWGHLAGALPVARYLPCDRKPRTALAIKGEARDLVRSLDLAKFNVIDIDTYGEPWEVLEPLLPRLEREVVIFLTHGHLGLSVTPSHAARRAAGLPVEWDAPLGRPLTMYLGEHAIRSFWRWGTVVSATTIYRPRVSYWAVRFRPNKSAQVTEPAAVSVIPSGHADARKRAPRSAGRRKPNG